jgi:nitrogen fixation/metabolism regulation signal transduction histidine kinase
MVEVEEKLGEADSLTNRQKELMNYYLVKFSNVFYTDINLYKTNGTLFATSRPEVFINGLLNEFMPYEVFEVLTLKHKSEYIHQESIGNLKYLSAYVPFRNYKNKVLAYLNLPYFAKQHALEEELANFYVALINIYVLIFVLSIILAVIFANYLSAPLRLIKSTISKLQIGKTNELIEWQTNDEIGELIKEYNKKVIELEKSARLLAKSERESAWREMAKQVAHEIKNPLTPMKLSIQHLQRIAAGIDANVKEKIDKTANILIEQIDTLATIATEFSNFAKLPDPHLEKIDVIKIAKDCSLLFEEQKAKIELINKTNNPSIFIRADKDQMIRIFNNLIKNAIQSVKPDKTPEIKIEISEQNNEIVIAVKDNGEGIPVEKQAKIFEPNFTTKTAGMGLGLAMVKSFVETFNGKIWFTSTEGKGTTFYMSFPK